MILSFGLAKAPALAKTKTVTRRDWSDKYASQFRPGTIHSAWTAAPYARGKFIGKIEIISIQREALVNLSKSREYAREELRKEGGLWTLPEFLKLFEELRFGHPFRVEFKWL
ncbi:MAG: hypothetical protein ABS95_01130 [Verrucomicrobia bacterium SCN 57-15]|nr:MAG: hypothetical protein ABS95_01130 [Verrucomicrobia bacterium SCN 57-15]